MTPTARAPQTLDRLPLQQPACVLAVSAPAERPEWARQLADIGFTPGEPVQVLRRASFGGDPLVARIGGGTFALRRAEAACVRVQAFD
jgi:ferrous iron transport protein A